MGEREAIDRPVPQRTGFRPYGARQNQATIERSRSCWVRLICAMRRHLERAQLDEPQAAGGAVGAVELVDADLGPVRVAGDVDQQVAENADRPARAGVGRSPRDLAECQLQLVDAVLPGLVETRRLAGRPHEHPGEQVGERRMVDEVAEQAAQHVGPPQERAVGGRRAAEDDVVAAAGSGVAPIEHELLGPEAAEARLLVERLGHLGRSVQLRVGWTFTSMTPGSGVTERRSSRWSVGGW